MYSAVECTMPALPTRSAIERTKPSLDVEIRTANEHTIGPQVRVEIQIANGVRICRDDWLNSFGPSHYRIGKFWHPSPSSVLLQGEREEHIRRGIGQSREAGRIE